jgi:MFS family permease
MKSPQNREPTLSADTALLKERLRRWTLILGVLQITVGCLVGMIPPSAVAWYRALVMAHLEFVANGILMVVLGLLVRELRLPPLALRAWFVTLQIGTWTNGGAGIVAAILGASSFLMPTINEKFPPPHGLEHPAVTGILQVCGITVVAALLLTLYGLVRSKTVSDNAAS